MIICEFKTKMQYISQTVANTLHSKDGGKKEKIKFLFADEKMAFGWEQRNEWIISGNGEFYLNNGSFPFLCEGHLDLYDWYCCFVSLK